MHICRFDSNVCRQSVHAEKRIVTYEISVEISSALYLIDIFDFQPEFFTSVDDRRFEKPFVCLSAVVFIESEIDIFRKSVDRVIALRQRRTALKDKTRHSCRKALQERGHIVIFLYHRLRHRHRRRRPSYRLRKQRLVLMQSHPTPHRSAISSQLSPEIVATYQQVVPPRYRLL